MIEMLQVRLTRLLRRVLTRPRIDLPLAAGLLLLAMAGLCTLYTAAGGGMALVGGQAARFVLGFALMLLISRIPPSVLRSWTPGLSAVSVALLVVVAILGEGRGSMRWPGRWRTTASWRSRRTRPTHCSASRRGTPRPWRSRCSAWRVTPRRSTSSACAPTVTSRSA